MALLDKLPDGADVLDLGAARVARAEARKSASFIKLEAGFVEVNHEVPLEAAYLFQQEDIKKGLSLLLADPADVAVLFEAGLTAQDLEAIVQFVSGKQLGE
jgi:hypothetical protein